MWTIGRDMEKGAGTDRHRVGNIRGEKGKKKNLRGASRGFSSTDARVLKLRLPHEEGTGRGGGPRGGRGGDGAGHVPFSGQRRK